MKIFMVVMVEKTDRPVSCQPWWVYGVYTHEADAEARFQEMCLEHSESEYLCVISTEAEEPKTKKEMEQLS